MTRPTPNQTGYAVVLLAAFLATLPLLLNGPSCGHDLSFHLLNWMDAAHQWRAGVLRPWWCAAAAWNTGEPRFLLYPPVSWVLGGLLTFVLGATHAPAAYTFVAFTASGLTMRRFLANYVASPLPLLGACLYLAHPYMLFTATERTAYAELLAAAWLPWLLQEALRDRISVPKLAIPVALLWLTNTPSAVLGTYTLAFILVFRLVQARRRRQTVVRTLLLPVGVGFLWGVAGSAFYLLPAVVQHSYVEVGQAFTSGMRPEDGTLFTHTGEAFHDHVVRQASWLAVILLATAFIAAVIALATHRRSQRLHGMRGLGAFRAHASERKSLAPILLALTVITAFLLTPASLFLWHHLPELQFLQFPWRTLMLQGVVTITLIVLTMRTPLRIRWASLIGLTAVAALSFTAHHLYAQVCDDEDVPSSLHAQYTGGAGFEPYDEYTPKDADNDLLHPGEPPAWTSSEATAPPSPAAAAHAHRLTGGSPDLLTFRAEPVTTDRFLIVRHRAFRNWHTTLDGVPVTPTDDRDDDLLAIPLPDAREHTVTLRYTWSFDQYAGIAVSLIALLALAYAWRNHSARSTVSS